MSAPQGKDAIERTAAQSASLRRELRLSDLVLLQVLLIVGLPWVGYAAKVGGAHVALWLAAIVLFYFPLAGTVIHLSRLLPLEGGVYQWVKFGLSPFAGFLSAWNYSFFLILFYATSGSVVANSLSYLLGPGAAWMTGSKPLILALNLAFFAIVLWINVRGLHLARWITSSGGVLVIALYTLIIGLLALRVVRGEPFAQAPVALGFPAVTLLTVNLFSKIAFNALSGFEQVAIFAGECHTPERNIARSVWIAGPGIALLYILGTCAMLAYTPQEKIDLIAPIAQILGASGASSGVVAVLSSVAILALLFAYFTQTVACVAQVSRLPMVAGWDGLLPAWFSALHPRYRTPVRSLMLVVAACLVLGAASLVQVGEQEAAQLLVGAGMACSGLYYLAMFAVVLRGKTSLWLKIGAVSAAGVTVLSVALQVVPILDTPAPGVFAAKVAGGVVLINAAGVSVYRSKRRQARPR
jgi:glutamate:GABA antiporter